MVRFSAVDKRGGASRNRLVVVRLLRLLYQWRFCILILFSSIYIITSTTFSLYGLHDAKTTGTSAALFTPDEFRAGRIENYVNLPTMYNPNRDDIVKQLIQQPLPEPTEILLHKAPTPPSSNAILGLASYPTFKDGWLKLVGSLRTNGYEGHIIVGVHPEIPEDERDYLDKMGVTYYAVQTANCSSAILEGVSQTGNAVRAKCSHGLENLKLEWGRYEMARRWLGACETCTGWSMVIDTRDIFFQADPFVSLGNANDAQHDLMFVEEVAQYTNPLPDKLRAINIGASGRYKWFTTPCYGKENVAPHKLLDRPMLCSGTVIGNRNGIHRFLTVLVNEFQMNNAKDKPECRSPHTTDQWTMNYLYYRGEFGFPRQTKTLPWGTGPVLTVGKPCATQLFDNSTKEHKHATSLKDMMTFDNNGLILNPHEKEGSPTRIAPTLHQWDRCRGWIGPWFNEHKDLYMRSTSLNDEPGVGWVT